jgi:hypothetical protein
MEKKLQKAVESSKRRISQSKDLIEKSRAIINEDQTVKSPKTSKSDPGQP